MRIIFLGTSHGVPEANRRCSCTLIETGGRRYIIDMGTQAIEQLCTRNIPPESINGVFITHMHGDHTNGLLSFIELCSWYFKKADPDFFLPPPMEGTIDALKGWLKCNGTVMRDFRFHEIKAGLVWDDGFIKVTAFKTEHTAESYSYLIEAEGKRVLFTGDLCSKHGKKMRDFPLAAIEEPVDLAVCEAAHFSAEKYLPIARNTGKIKKICFNHYTEAYLESVIRVKKQLDIPVTITSDGTEIEV